MHIILTHEQADFDALASLLAAHLLCETTVPVLPRRINRNVRAFLSLYGMEFPFVDPRDLPVEPIEKITLVDTQSLVSIKGMAPDTLVHVIDHHPLRDGIPDVWSLSTHEVGATTTVLVEEMREQNGGLTTIQATLLLLGVYEDTGSLTYTRTSSRDLRAAAFLMEQGANLSIANDFLNHPLSPEQQAIYDRLRANAKHLHIHGHTIILACGDAQEMDEELSSIAHKLRDLYDPDALFLIVSTRGGVQFIARSTSDHIDVAEIAATFGGGGHERAAAGLIRGKSPQSVCEDLEKILPDHIHPAITVSQIMSRSPQLLDPDTPVDEAAAKMRRFGYEGYPVVQDGKVIGLLTRRAVDRAISHKLNLTASSLMEAGEYCVTTDDSIEHFQRLVTETGWGQIPVVDKENNEIIGIVTRTDLLKTLAPKPAIPGRLNIASRLESALPEDRLILLRAIAAEAQNQQSALYLVGGFVRDLLLDQPSLDFDLVVEGDAIGLARALTQRYGGRVTGHSRFGTAKWLLAEQKAGQKEMGFSVVGVNSVDLVSARTEFYTHPTALPTVERGSIKLDLHRRDFTINTLALRLDGRHYGELHDYWGGLNDLHAGLVRVLHSLSFVDDPTRILRAVRFEQRFDFSIETRSMQLLAEARSLLDRVSGDRIRHELDHILASTCSIRIIERLYESNLLAAIHPHLIWNNWLREKFKIIASAQPQAYWEIFNAKNKRELKRDLGYVVWLLPLPFDQVGQVVKRLKLPVRMVRTILSACDVWNALERLSSLTPSEVVNMLEGAPNLALYACYLATADQQIRDVIDTYVLDWRKVTPFISGHDLKALGLPPGPIYRQILRQLRNARLEGNIKNQEDEMVLLEELINVARADL